MPGSDHDRRDATPGGGADTPAPDWQKLACAIALRGRFSVITGGPGTGKTYTAARLLAALLATAPDASRLRVALAAPTGKAAARLKQSIEQALTDLAGRLASGPAADAGGAAGAAEAAISGGEAPAAGQAPTLDLAGLVQRMQARTIHALLGARPGTRAFAHDARHPLDVDVLIVDEASMVHLEMMAALLAALPPTARLVLLGDKDQLASVEAGAVLGDLCRHAEAGGYDEATRRFAAEAAGVELPAAFLAPAGQSASALAQHIVMLRKSRRFGGPIGQLALAVNQGDASAARRLLASPGGGAPSAGGGAVANANTDVQGGRGSHPLAAYFGPSPQAAVGLALAGRPGAEGGYRPYLELVAQGPAASAATQAAQPEFARSGAAASSPAISSTDAARHKLPSESLRNDSAHTAWVKAVLRAFEKFRLLCAVREGEWGTAGLNRAVAQALAHAGLLQPAGEWYAGRPVMVTRNDPALGVFNGDIGIALPGPRTTGTTDTISDTEPDAPTEAAAPAARSGEAGPGTRSAPRLRVWFLDGNQLRSVPCSRLPQVETAFAMTVHKSQGSEFDHTVLVLPPQAGGILGRELVYTGITRARSAFSLVAPSREVFLEALGRVTVRASGLATGTTRELCW